MHRLVYKEMHGSILQAPVHSMAVQSLQAFHWLLLWVLPCNVGRCQETSKGGVAGGTGPGSAGAASSVASAGGRALPVMTPSPAEYSHVTSELTFYTLAGVARKEMRLCRSAKFQSFLPSAEPLPPPFPCASQSPSAYSPLKCRSPAPACLPSLVQRTSPEIVCHEA